ncbi:hypothetical protein V8E36_006719, partial [Tilletia maclaganii]
IPSAPIASGQVAVLEVRGKGGVITVGPFQAATAEADIVFSFGDIAAQIRAFKDDSSPTILNANVVCPAQARPASLAFVATGGSGSTDEIVPTGGGVITTIPIDSTAGVTGFTYACAGDVVISVGGFRKTNSAVAAGSTFSVSGGQGNIYLTKQVTDQITSRFSNAAAFSLDVSQLNFLASNANPSTLNAIPAGGVSSPIQPLTENAVVTLPSGAPATVLPDITFTASGPSGSTTLLSLGDAAGTVHVYDASNAEIVKAAFSCPALSPAPPVFPFNLN